MHKHYWKNWSGNQACEPIYFHRPETVEEIIKIVSQARQRGQCIRVVGAGHSWSPLVATSDHLISLDKHNRILNVDRQELTVTVQAGIRLYQLNAQLAQYGLALSNLGTIDQQSLAGVISTGTHGSGINYGIIATQVVDLELITGRGEIVYCDKEQNPDIFYAALCGLGSLGVISTVTIRCEMAFNLHCVEEKVPLDYMLNNLESLIQNNEHFKFYWIPYANVCLTFSLNRTKQPVQRPQVRKLVDHYVARNLAYDSVCRLGSCFKGYIPTFNRLLTKFAATRAEYVDVSHSAFCFPIYMKHWESEYAIPVENTVQTFCELREFIEGNDLPVNMTMEYRFANEDEIWLSPAYRRKSCFVDAIQHCSLPYEGYFRGVDQLLRKQKARPHWGKLHYKTSDELATLYPAWPQFLEVRHRLDPDNVFMNPYLEELLGPE